MSGFDKPKSIKVFADNQGAIDSGKNQAITQRNKHIDIQYHYVRDVVALGKVEFVHCSTEDMLADPLTKTTRPRKIRKTGQSHGNYFEKILSSFDRGGALKKCRISEAYHIDPKISLSDLD